MHLTAGSVRDFLSFVLRVSMSFVLRFLRSRSHDGQSATAVVHNNTSSETNAKGIMPANISSADRKEGDNTVTNFPTINPGELSLDEGMFSFLAESWSIALSALDRLKMRLEAWVVTWAFSVAHYSCTSLATSSKSNQS